MKALSMRQPWAWLIAHGIKDIENRNWMTDFRGEFLIHASQTFDQDGYVFVKNNFNLILPKSYEFFLGGIVGKAKIIDCVDTNKSPWFFGKYGFVISDAKSIDFKKIRGQQGFFDVAEII